MLLLLPLIFIVLPIAEIFFFFEVTEVLGFAKVFFEVLLTGFVGLQLMRGQGLQLMAQMQAASLAGQEPSRALTRGLFQFLGGLLLFVPGILTDIIGLTFLLPGFSQLWSWLLLRQLKTAMSSGRVHVYGARWGQQGPFQDQQPQWESATTSNSNPTDVIEAEVIDIQKKSTSD